jgi:hypothetical protein
MSEYPLNLFSGYLKKVSEKRKMKWLKNMTPLVI